MILDAARSAAGSATVPTTRFYRLEAASMEPGLRSRALTAVLSINSPRVSRKKPTAKNIFLPWSADTAVELDHKQCNGAFSRVFVPFQRYKLKARPPRHIYFQIANPLKEANMAPPRFLPWALLLLLPLLSFLPAALSTPRCNPYEKRVLFQIKKALGDPDILVTWTADTDCCADWANVVCDPDTGRVVSLEISFSNASGHIPPIVGDLSSLNVLRVRKNGNVQGPIPPAIAKLSKLKELWLDMNHLTGPVPDFLGRMATLEYINLDSNKLSGYIPPSLGDLPSLQGVFLADNRLQGTIPASLGRLRHPTGLYIVLSRNRLVGPIPQSFKILNISRLELSGNRLTGNPSVLFRTADMVTSQFTATLDLSRNRFAFDLSGAEFSTKLGKIDLRSNRIYGRIPAQLGKIDGLEYIDLSHNLLCGEIPQGGRLQIFKKDQFLHNKCLCGDPLPPCM
ncbi:hypothetical protein Taro_034881 [Colocasia esculenta]|uniref:Leucine-rich repeat-containing N-terminal plant-type domain-containing protein n=1 Tax=Colocasia esculenta TaxID=4460 RepID=A0A843W462_COLES|nr:hypothetical protein [Colocasia esculenta]